jgi:hypothetical protein
VLVSNSDSVAGSTSHDAVVEVAGVESVGVVTGAAVVSVVAEFVGAATGAAVFARTVTAADEELRGELPAPFVATVLNLYEVPAVNPVIVQEPDAPSTVHVLLSGVDVTV